MRFLPLLFCIFSIPLILIGCSKDSEKPVLITEHPSGLHKQGEFYRYNKVEDIGTYETGSITIEVETAETIKGSMDEDIASYDTDEYKDMEIISVQLKFGLNEEIEDNLSFSNNENIHLVTDTDEMVNQPDQSLSSVIDMSTLKNARQFNAAPYSRYFMFQLEDSTAQEIKQAILLIDAPIDSKGNAAGEPLEIEIDFSKE
ncbi:hypothetical protein [Oceanobacillus neutriphilus]|uniref:Lipoprotein n=1 Tax=Oceanobacillus neutriphilus TaxID=531815 RepID=A0ABQ2NVD6_9BACI|nr:hypothetical protein [Oceanobacillus neutriphilus]GGP11471.1 hypothetical protein GCM10011346_23760 [Oceanobacillus neutriphilus]